MELSGILVEGKNEILPRSFGNLIRTLVIYLNSGSGWCAGRSSRSQFDSNDPNALQDLFNRTYTHFLWAFNKYSVDKVAADKLEEKCVAR
ncbi:hypothetical protein LguiB_011145 [Lonicera macranthoides]